MAFFDTLKETITGRPANLKEPTFIKDECSAQAQIDRLEELKKAAPPDIAKQIEQDIKLLSYGTSGEDAVAYELKHSYMPILILRDLYLEYKGLTAQIDYVVIDNRFVLVIECKTMVGDIEITSNGDFIRHFKNAAGKVYKKEGIYSPIVQNQRHLEIIKRLICDNMSSVNEKKCKDVLHSIVVFANPKTIVNMKYAKAEVKKGIIRGDQLITHMKSLHSANKDGLWFAEEGMYRVADILMAHHRENTVDYTKKYGFFSPVKAENKKEIVSEIVAESPESYEESPIYKELKDYRLLKSREESIKAYLIYNNNELSQIIELMPRTIDDLMKVPGFGEVKCKKYGEAITDIVKKYA